jgi:DNA repair exonuclease SbcCD nuclease subunit
MKPYGLFSDVHAHPWSAFSTTLPSGLNSRLGLILDEMWRMAQEVLAAGGDTLVFAGDLFHQRGAIDPEVFNPTYSLIERIAAEAGLRVLLIPGNHDLKGRNTTELGNAMQKLDAIIGVDVITQPKVIPELGLALVPWFDKVNDLKFTISDLANAMNQDALLETDLVIHAGIDGVIPGLPDHGLSSAWLAEQGFRRVFAGHYHHHKVMEGGAVISIGATTQQTWSDVGTKAGFLIVEPDKINYRASNAPSFVDIDETTDEDELPLIVDGNYVRVRGMKLTDLEVKTMRDELDKLGARGVSFQVARAVVSARTGAAPKTTTLEESVGAYVDGLALPDAAAVKAGALDVLASVRSLS